MRKSSAALLVAGAAAGAYFWCRHKERIERLVRISGLASRSGARMIRSAPQLYAASGERREHLREELALETADDVTSTLGNMKGVLMKIGQMASYIDEGMSPEFRSSLSRLQASAPPMSPELAARVIREELGGNPEDIFASWDPLPIASASIGQVHRAMDRKGNALAVKVQYPTVAATMRADLANVRLLRHVLGMAFPGLDVQSLMEELRERLLEELDYRREAENQREFAGIYEGHPTIRIPKVFDEWSTERVLTQELVVGSTFQEAVRWPQKERDLAAETIFRFVFGSLYRHGIFNGDPHPGNYLFHGKGTVTFLDFGLVKRFEQRELDLLLDGVRYMVLDPDGTLFRKSMEEAGFLHRNAPVTVEQIIESFRPFYDMVIPRDSLRITSEFATDLTRHFFDRNSPVAPYADVPREYVVLQRINVGLISVIGELGATGPWRAIADEIWPIVSGPPSTPMGEEIARWRTARPSGIAR